MISPNATLHKDANTILVDVENPPLRATTSTSIADGHGCASTFVLYTKQLIPSLAYDPFFSLLPIKASDVTSTTLDLNHHLVKLVC